jgi:hypothetical protein
MGTMSHDARQDLSPEHDPVRPSRRRWLLVILALLAGLHVLATMLYIEWRFCFGGRASVLLGGLAVLGLTDALAMVFLRRAYLEKAPAMEKEP